MPKVLPDEVLTDILIRLPGKQISRCKCVCKRWRSVIGSQPFQKAYGKWNRGLLIYWSDDFRCDWKGGVCTRRHYFSYCPLRRHGEPPEELSPLSELELRQYLSGHLDSSASFKRFLSSNGCKPCDGMTLVDGLLCVGELAESHSSFYFKFTLHNICTGEKMNLPDPLPSARFSTYHLGYDPANRVYKLLRLIFNDGNNYDLEGAHILTLRPPSSSESKWRELDLHAPGLEFLRKVSGHRLLEVTASPDEGMLWWLCWDSTPCESALGRGLLCFDFNMDRFRYVEPPRDYHYEPFSNFQAITRFKDRLALWLPDKHERNVLLCYVLEDDEGKTWSRQRVEISEDFKESKWIGLPSGKLLVSPSSNANMLVMDRCSSRGKPLRVFSYSARQTPRDARSEDLFFVGKVPYSRAWEEEGRGIYFFQPDHKWHSLQKDGTGRVSCLLDGNHLHLRLHDILGGVAASASL